MPCQCGQNAMLRGETEYSECGCATDPEASCECGSGMPSARDRELALERVVMQLDKRVRALEGSRQG